MAARSGGWGRGPRDPRRRANAGASALATRPVICTTSGGMPPRGRGRLLPGFRRVRPTVAAGPHRSCSWNKDLRRVLPLEDRPRRRVARPMRMVIRRMTRPPDRSRGERPMTANALDVFVLPMVVWLGGLFLATAALKALA